MNKKMDELYPQIGFDIKARMKTDETGKWYFETETHILGPDDVITKRSQSHASKKNCLFNFISELPKFIQRSMEEL